MFKDGAAEVLNAYTVKREAVALGFGQPQESLEEALEISTSTPSASNIATTAAPTADDSETGDLCHVNITDEEKEKLKRHSFVANESNRPFLDMVLSALDCVENDYMALLALCLIYALANNKGNCESHCISFSFEQLIKICCFAFLGKTVGMCGLDFFHIFI